MRHNKEDVESKETVPSPLKAGYVPKATCIEPPEDQPLDAEFIDSLLNSWITSNLPTDQMNSMVELATKTFEEVEYAHEWLNKPNPATDDKPPIALLGTEHGFKRVETLIQRLAYGIVA